MNVGSREYIYYGLKEPWRVGRIYIIDSMKAWSVGDWPVAKNL